MRVPDQAGKGKAKITLSFPDWNEGNVAPAQFEVPIIEPEAEDSKQAEAKADVDLTKIERTIAKEPVYKSKPRYCLLVFGPEAKTRVWLVRDGDVLYVDRNGNGDLTEVGERVESKGGRAIFYAGDITQADGKSKHTGLIVNFERDKQEHFVDLTVQVRAKYTYCAFVGPSTERPQDAPIVQFDGPLTMTLFNPAQVLARGDKPCSFCAAIVTADPKSGRALMGPVVYNWEMPKDIHPVADIEFSNKKPGEPPIKIKVLLTRRD